MADSRISWKGLAEILGILGVIGSLVFVALEIQQNTDAVRSATIQAISEQAMETARMSIENPDLREALRAVLSDNETLDQRQVVNNFYRANLLIRQNRHLQVELGVIDEDISAAIGTGGIYRTPEFGEYWSNVKNAYSPDFQEYVEQELLQ